MDGLAFVQMGEIELKKRHISKEQFYRESGISSATMSQWRKRIYSPSSAAIKKIEEYLGIEFSLEQKEKPLVNGDEELTEYLEILKTRPEMRMLFQLSKDATKEDVEAAVRIIEALRNK